MLPSSLASSESGRVAIRLFFTTDIHGSERCFLKFVNAAAFYEADVIVMGGDMTGKAIVPLVYQGAGQYSCTFVGRTYHVQDGDDSADLE